MAISVVNGYVCTSSCDVAKAKKGEDPHPLTGADKVDPKAHETSGTSRKDGPAVLFGGSLSELFAARSVTGTDAAQTTDQASTRKPVVDRLA